MNILFSLLFIVLLSHSSYSWGVESHPWQEKQFEIVLDQVSSTVEYEKPLIKFNHEIDTSSMGDSSIKKEKFNFFFNQALYYLTADTSKRYHNRYKKFLSYYRKSLLTHYYQKNYLATTDSDINLLQEIAFQLYTTVNLHAYKRNLTNTIAYLGGVKKPPTTPTADHQIAQLIHLREKIIAANNFYNGIRNGKHGLNTPLYEKVLDTYKGGVTWAKLDLSFMGSAISQKYRIHRKDRPDHPLHFIRMSTPTIGSNEKTTINPEFLCYLTALKKKGLSHTYINFQDRRHLKISISKSPMDFIKSLGINSESYRTDQIENLENHPELEKVVDILTLSKNSAFYFQENIENKINEPKELFLKRYMYELFHKENSGFHTPLKWREKSSPYQSKAQDILSKLLDVLFPKQILLTPAEKRVYIEISYIYLINLATQDSFSANITCKDGIDRAGASHALTYILVSIFEIISNQITTEDFQDRVDNLYTVIFADALAVKKREILKAKLQRFQQAAVFLIDSVGKRPEVGGQLAKLSTFEKMNPFKYLPEQKSLELLEISDSL